MNLLSWRLCCTPQNVKPCTCGHPAPPHPACASVLCTWACCCLHCAAAEAPSPYPVSPLPHSPPPCAAGPAGQGGCRLAAQYAGPAPDAADVAPAARPSCAAHGAGKRRLGLGCSVLAPTVSAHTRRQGMRGWGSIFLPAGSQLPISAWLTQRRQPPVHPAAVRGCSSAGQARIGGARPAAGQNLRCWACVACCLWKRSGGCSERNTAQMVEPCLHLRLLRLLCTPGCVQDLFSSPAAVSTPGLQQPARVVPGPVFRSVLPRLRAETEALLDAVDALVESCTGEDRGGQITHLINWTECLQTVWTGYRLR